MVISEPLNMKLTGQRKSTFFNDTLTAFSSSSVTAWYLKFLLFETEQYITNNI